MDYIVSILRRDAFLRILTWILLSTLLGTFGMLVTLSICVFVMPFIEVEATLARAAFVLIAHLMALAIPQQMLLKLSKSYGTAPPTHATLSVVAWIFIGEPIAFVFAFALIHLALSAEVIGVLWQKKLKLYGGRT